MSIFRLVKKFDNISDRYAPQTILSDSSFMHTTAGMHTPRVPGYINFRVASYASIDTEFDN